MSDALQAHGVCILRVCRRSNNSKEKGDRGGVQVCSLALKFVIFPAFRGSGKLCILCIAFQSVVKLVFLSCHGDRLPSCLVQVAGYHLLNASAVPYSWMLAGQRGTSLIV